MKGAELRGGEKEKILMILSELLDPAITEAGQPPRFRSQYLAYCISYDELGCRHLQLKSCLSAHL